MNNTTKVKINNAFTSMVRADYLSLDNKEDLDRLNKYFVDPFNTISTIVQKQDNFISGRRGTGKTTALLKAYYECLKTIQKKPQSDHLIDGHILPIYIDLSSCTDIFNKTDLNLLEIHFVRQIINNMRKQIEANLEERYLTFFHKRHHALEDLDIIEKLLLEGTLVSFSKDISSTKTLSEEFSDEVDFNASNKGIKASLKAGGKNNCTESYNFDKTKGLNIQELLDRLKSILDKSNIDYMYLFLDEYSDLNDSQQKHMSKLLKHLLGSKTNIFVKIGVITDRYDFGNDIILGRDIFHIPLDLNEHVERLGGLSIALKTFERLVEELVNKRFEAFNVGLTIDDIMKTNKSEIISRISRESIGVTRTIGLILQNAWKQAELAKNQIGLTDINYGIRAVRKMYSSQFEGIVSKNLIPSFFSDMWSDILKKAISQKQKHPNRPASHILLDPKRKHYLNVFKENFLLHLLEENRSSKYGGNYNLYSIDYDICSDLKIKYAETKDEYTAARFIYDNVLSKYDGYFSKQDFKSYRCPQCDKIYKENDVIKYKVKRCFDDDTILQEIEHKKFEVTKGNFAEVELKIIGLISTLKKENSMSAMEIANAVGCSIQKVSSWCSKTLTSQGYISIEKKSNKNYYYGTK